MTAPLREVNVRILTEEGIDLLRRVAERFGTTSDEDTLKRALIFADELADPEKVRGLVLEALKSLQRDV